MRNRVSIIIVISLLSVVGCLFPRRANSATSAFQSHNRNRRQTRRIGQTRNRKLSSRDYSSFSHRSDKHKSLSCNACHVAPTSNWQKASAFPDVADFPTHDACLRCHRAQFFKGARPVICSVCHTSVSPRAKERFTFKKPNQPSQFGTIFPHDKHQDVLASRGPGEIFGAAHAVRRTLLALDEKTYRNCTICHETEKRLIRPEAGFVDGFEPPPNTFKTVPVGHESCFNCHWKSQKPAHDNCDGCHKLSETDIAALRIPTRLSLKFRHERGVSGDQHVAECTACHINITGVKSVESLKPDVPISACAEGGCHATSDKNASIQSEVIARNDDPDFFCKKCHTSDVGRKRPVPASHRAVVPK